MARYDVTTKCWPIRERESELAEKFEEARQTAQSNSPFFFPPARKASVTLVLTLPTITPRRQK